MALSTKMLIVRPEDVEGVALGGTSSVAGVTITAEYDRTIEAGGEVFLKGVRTPLKWDATVGHWGISLVAADDPAITSGQGACVIVRIEVQHRQGHGAGGSGHSRGLTYAKTIQIIQDDPATTPYGSKASVVPVPEDVVMLDPAQVMKAAEAVDLAQAAQTSAADAATAAQEAADSAAVAEGAAFATVDSGTAELISNPTAGPQTQATGDARWSSGLSVKTAGAIGDGVTDDTAAFEAWIGQLNALGERANGLGGKGVAGYIPAGNYYLPNGLATTIQKDAITIVGAANGASVITTNAGRLFSWSNPSGMVKSGGARDLTIRCTAPNSTQVCFVADFASELSFRNVKFAKVGQILQAGTTAARYANGLRFTGIRGTAYNLANRPVFDLLHGAGLYLTDVDMVGDNVTYPTDATSLHGAANGRFWINASTGSWDTISEVQVITNRFYAGLWIAPPSGSTVVNIKLTNVWHDYCAVAAIKVAPTGGNVTKLDATNCYLVATDGHGVHIAASSGLVDQFHFAGVTSIFCGQNNWRVEGSVKNVSLTDCYGIGANRLGGNNTGDTQDSLVIHGSDWTVLGGTYGQSGQPYNGITNQARYGLTTDSTADRYAIIGTKLGGTSAAQQNLHTPTTGGTGRVVRGVTGVGGSRINSFGMMAMTVPPSGVAATHSIGCPAVLYVTGGTVTTVTIDGSSTGLTSGAFHLSPGSTWAITYSAAPTVTRQVIL